MQIRSEQPPGIDLVVTRRAALGGLLAAVLTPALLTGKAELTALAQQPTPGVPPVPRTDHTTTMLPDGMVLVAGGSYLGTLSSAQIYDMTAKSWSSTGDLNTPRTKHAAAMLDGMVVVCGGIYHGIMSDTEVYDPSSGIWTSAAPMNIPRFGHSAAPLNGGVVVYGGTYLGTETAPEFFDGTSWTLL